MNSPINVFPNSHLYFENHSCKYYPCHKVNISKDGFNCMGCRCNLYCLEVCPGIESGDAIILTNGVKDCSKCSFPHLYKNREQMSLVFIKCKNH